jgi:hypothetical protein
MEGILRRAAGTGTRAMSMSQEEELRTQSRIIWPEMTHGGEKNTFFTQKSGTFELVV